MVAVLVVSCLIGVASGGHAQHASWTQLEELWHAEYKAVEHIKAVMQPVAELGDVLKTYVESWEALVDGLEPHDWGSEDPAAGFSLLRHVAEGWTRVDDALQRIKSILHNIEFLASRPDREPLPNTDDVAAASEAVARLAHVYRLNTTALGEGGLLVLDPMAGYHHPLSANELMSIGLVAVKKGFLDVGVQFLRAAKSRASIVQLPRLENMLTAAVKVHDHVLEVNGPRSLVHVTATAPYGSLGETSHTEGVKASVVLGVDYLKRHTNATWMLERRPLVEQVQVERLCRGEDLRPPHVTSRLRCRYATGGSPWLALAPFKVEQVSLDPYITVVYELVSRGEADQLKKRVKSHLHIPYTPSGSDSLTPAVEGSWSLKQYEAETAVLMGVGRRMRHLLGVTLDNTASEPYMVADYGLGGEYSAHRDTHGPTRTPPHTHIGERLATVLTYLQAPTQGGRTVFPWVGAGVGGTAGAAMVWWNLLSSHEHDFLTRHAACPVMRGRKTVVTKWVGYVPQWRKMSCSADPSRKVMLPWH
ncbi:Prolyl 4-hydroxylase subunit alpha-2 [Portunus trituberculatus]|uniref:procollagen-proline 4-dioxygenase n=1 Tax=Portunus trituberculatus TaxID=210409 RepID=A0A5B7E0D0_PORTR|nr:Prolyl 4-hydroxylase subunit alpha-2 [Portunus trituberculatus]